MNVDTIVQRWDCQGEFPYPDRTVKHWASLAKIRRLNFLVSLTKLNQVAEDDRMK
jgi:hypothetical protein